MRCWIINIIVKIFTIGASILVYSTIVHLCLTFPFCDGSADASSLRAVLYNKKILAFGDSLTHGLHVSDRGIGHHPYAFSLNHALRNISTEVYESGFNGMTAKKMKHQLPITLVNLSGMHTPTVVIILAGTNDLLHGLAVNDILLDVLELHKIVQQHAIHIKQAIYTLAITIPELPDKELEESRRTINEGIRNYVQRCNRTSYLADFENLFNQSNKTNEKYWSSDYLHFSPQGYNALAMELYETLSDYTKKIISSRELNFIPTEVCA